MNSLKALIDEKTKEKQKSDSAAGKKWVSRGEAKKRQAQQCSVDNPASDEKRQKETEERISKISDLLAVKKASKNVKHFYSKESAARIVPPSEISEETEIADDENPTLPRVEVFRRLRRLRAPVTYFGESDEQRFKRMCKLELARHDDETKDGRQNIFIDVLSGRERTRTEHFDDEEDDLITLNSVTKEQSSISNPSGFAAGDPNETDEGERSGDTSHKYSLVDPSSANAIDSSTPCFRVRNWMKQMLRIWDDELHCRSDEEKRTADGKMATALHHQTRKDLKPLLKKLKANRLEPEVLEKLDKMVIYCEKKQYRNAHDLYMLLAIGNAAWPMGVTMVGIHERAGRSKIFTSEVAHILNDETTRKYIQMFKRLMSFAQRKFPTDPSQMVKISTVNV
ncbi:Prp18 domain-containing protein [Cardiosporidium cionae]|uniref:Pre-mRNA-splicing factor 18 n=1 Tax=Cardiosporidium cionae TaxID=476202 RepID=A0ABQ7JAP2_9APIC|nr:Prp18 domain-containing protein [Cardiosporidium cionae]|eukprot:KAF8821068.1 Prp18 domain-containing protein [Cardiosporidium cionae]